MLSSAFLYVVALLHWCHRSEAAWTEILDHGSVGGFPSHAQATRLLESFVLSYPDVLVKRKIGTSFQGRPMYAYVLGTSRAPKSPASPQVLLTALTHAREPAGLTVVLYFLGRMLELYARRDPEAMYVLHYREVWLVPFVNPDGYVANELSSSKILRKNQRPTCSGDADSTGVDLNRNFGYRWKHEFDGCNEEYEGSGPFSEPETQALRKICEENNFRAAMNFHTYGGMLTHPYNWAKRPALPEDDQRVYSEIGDVFGWPRFGPAILTVGYTTSGEADDWMYGVRGIISMSPEVGPEGGNFWPPSSTISGINTRNFARTLYVVHKAGMELNARWIQQPLQADDLGHASARTLPGGAPDVDLQLLLSNTGLSASAGLTLGIAVVGAVVQSPDIRRSTPAALVSNQGSRIAWAHLVDTSGSGLPALVFALPSLPRRSSQHFSLLIGRSLEHHGSRLLRVCVAEAPASKNVTSNRSSAPAICRCSGLASLHGSNDRLASSSELQNFSWVLAHDAADGLQSLCAAAAAFVSEELPQEASAKFIKDPSNAVVGAALVSGARHDLHVIKGQKIYESSVPLLLVSASIVLGICALVRMQRHRLLASLVAELCREADNTSIPRSPAALRDNSMLELTAGLCSSDV